MRDCLADLSPISNHLPVDSSLMEKTPSCFLKKKKRQLSTILTPKPISNLESTCISPFKKLTLNSTSVKSNCPKTTTSSLVLQSPRKKILYAPRPSTASLLNHWSQRKHQDRVPLKSLATNTLYKSKSHLFVEPNMNLLEASKLEYVEDSKLEYSDESSPINHRCFESSPPRSPFKSRNYFGTSHNAKMSQKKTLLDYFTAMKSDPFSKKGYSYEEGLAEVLSENDFALSSEDEDLFINDPLEDSSSNTLLYKATSGSLTKRDCAKYSVGLKRSMSMFAQDEDFLNLDQMDSCSSPSPLDEQGFVLKRSDSLYCSPSDSMLYCSPQLLLTPASSPFPQEFSGSGGYHQDLCSGTKSMENSFIAATRGLSEENGERCQLPFVETGKDALKRISSETLRDLIMGKYDDCCDEKYVIDCRFPYEFEGGHIQSALNINTMAQLDSIFFPSSSSPLRIPKNGISEIGLQNSPGTALKRTIIVLHCEFSSHRAPRMALHLRKQDRFANMAHYPSLTYPEIYILKGGYKEFFSTQKIYCQPSHYVEMNDQSYREELKKEMSAFRKSWKRSKSFSIAASHYIDS